MASRARRPILTTLLLLCLAGSARAADPAEEARVREASTLIKRLAEYAAAKQKADVERSLPRLVKLHNELKSKTVRGKLLAAAADLMQNEDLGGARMAVAGALAEVNDPKGAWKHLKGLLPSVKVTASGLLPLRVIQTVGALAPDAALPTLLQLMQKAKDANVARYAIQALGKYGWSKQRVKVLAELLDYLRKLRPGASGGKGGKAGGAEARRRFNFVRETLLVALGELTGQKLLDEDKWLAAHKANKKSLGKLFTFER